MITTKHAQQAHSLLHSSQSIIVMCSLLHHVSSTKNCLYYKPPKTLLIYSSDPLKGVSYLKPVSLWTKRKSPKLPLTLLLHTLLFIKLFINVIKLDIKLCPTLCNPMDYSTPDLPLPHYLPKFAQVHMHTHKKNQEEIFCIKGELFILIKVNKCYPSFSQTFKILSSSKT